MQLIQKGLIVITGVPASGKSFFANKLKQNLQKRGKICKILSTDNLEAFLTISEEIRFESVEQLCSKANWDRDLQKLSLNKNKFNEKAWKFSRQFIESPSLLSILVSSCQILIIEDQLPLKSQRKPFRKYCSEKDINFLEIQISVSLQQALLNNEKRGQTDQSKKVSNEVILKSLQKFQTSPDALIVNQENYQEILSMNDFSQLLKKVTIKDNYTEYLSKKAIIHQHTQKQLDENELRKLIAKIINEQHLSQEYFVTDCSKKEKAEVLAECKKVYVHSKRSIPFKQIVQQFMAGRQGSIKI